MNLLLKRAIYPGFGAADSRAILMAQASRGDFSSISHAVAEKVQKSVKDIFEEYGVMATVLHPLDFGKTYRHHGNVLAYKIKGKEGSIVYRDSKFARSGYIVNTPIGIHSFIEFPSLVLGFGKTIGRFIGFSPATTWFANATNTIRFISNNLFVKVLGKFLAPLMMTNAFFEYQRKDDAIRQVDEFIGRFEELLQNPKDFVRALHEKYFALSSDEMDSINKETDTYKTSQINKLFESDKITLEMASERITTLVNKKIEALVENHLTLKLQELALIVGKAAVIELSSGVMEMLQQGVNDQQKAFQVQEVINGIVAQAKCKKTADRIDQVVQVCFAIVAVTMLIGSAASGVGIVFLVAGWTLWLGSLAYNSSALAKRNWEHILTPIEPKLKISWKEAYSIVATYVNEWGVSSLPQIRAI